MNDRQRNALAKRIEADIQTSRRNGLTARDLRMENAAGVARALTHQLGEDYSFAELEAALAKEMEWAPSVLRETAADVAARIAAKGPTRDQVKAMTASEKLSYANAKALEEMKAAAAAAVQPPPGATAPDGKLSAMQKLSLAREWAKLGVAPEAEAKPVAKADLARLDAARRLSHANEEALREANKPKPKNANQS